MKIFTNLFCLKVLLIIGLIPISNKAIGQSNYVPTAGSTTTINIPSSGYSFIYDPGGPGGTLCPQARADNAPGNYPNCDCTTTIHLIPDNPLNPVQLDFFEFAVNATFDYLIVYDNNTATGTELYNNGSGGAQSGDRCPGPGMLTATNPTGALTIVFHASGVVDDGGFGASILGGALPAANDAGVASIDSPSVFCPGVENIVATIENYGTNVINTVDVNWTVNGTPQTTYTHNAALGISGSGTETAQVTLGSFNFVSGSYEIKVWTSNPNGVADTTNFNDTMILVVGPALSGTYTIGSAPSDDYPDFSSAANDLNNFGVCGPVIFNVSAGTYTDNLHLLELAGASATNSITFDGMDSSLVTLTYSSTSDMPTVFLEGADYITIRNMTIENTSTSDGWGILLQNEADNNTIDQVHVRMPVTTTTDIIAIIASSSLTGESSGNNANYLTVSNSLITGGESGVHLDGGTSSATHNIGNTVINNMFRMQDDHGIEMDGQTAVTITGNDIDQLQNTGGDGIYLIDVDEFDVSANRVISPDYGIYINDGNDGYTQAANSTVINNMVYSSSDYGLYLNDFEYTVVYHNTLVGEPAMLINDQSNTLIIKNNIMYSTADYAFESTDALNVSDVIDYNLYYSGAANAFAISGTTYADLAAWQLIDPTRNVNSLYGDPQFVMPFTDLHTSGPLPHAAGDPSVGVAVDFDGQTRPIPSGTNPDIGADEYFASAIDAGVINITTQPGGNIVAEVFNYGTSTLTSVTVNVAVDNGTSVTTIGPVVLNSTLLSGESDTITVGNFAFTPGLMYEITSWTSNPNNTIDEDLTNDSTSIIICTPLAGSYTINSNSPTLGTNFNSFTDATNALNTCGITASVYFTVAANSGPYNEQISLSQVSGASATDTIVFDGVDTSNTHLFNSGTSSNYAVFTLDGADYVTIMNMTIEATAVTDNWGILLINNANNNNILNNRILMDTTATADVFGIVASNSSTSETSEENNANYTLIQGNHIIGGEGSIQLEGDFGAKNTNNRVINNYLDNPDDVGLELDEQDSIQFIDNTISIRRGTAGDGFYSTDIENFTITGNIITVTDYGIYISDGNLDGGSIAIIDNNTVISEDDGIYITDIENFSIQNNSVTIINNGDDAMYIDDANMLGGTMGIIADNYIDALDGDDGLYTLDLQNFEVRRNIILANDYAFYISGANDDNSQRSIIANNMVSSMSDYGFYTFDADGIDIFHNTFYGSPAAYFSSPDAGLDIRNNIFYGVNDFAFESSLETGFTTIDYNLYYSIGTDFLNFGSNSYTTLAAWVAANPAFNASSVSGDPIIISSTDLHVKGILPNDAGDNSVGITIDIDGQTRPLAPSTTVDIGADEFTPPALEVSLLTILEPVSGCGDSNTVVSVIVTNYGTTTVSNIPVTVDISGGLTTSLTGAIPGPMATGDIDTFTVGTINTFNGGVFDFTAYTQLVGDEELSNDTAFASATFTAIPVADSNFGSICIDAGTSVTVAVNDTAYDYNWYDAALNLVGTGDTFTSGPIMADEEFYAEAFVSSQSIVITEVSGDVPYDLVEIQNVTDQPIDVTGWILAVSVDNSTAYDISTTLSGVMNPGDVIFFDDNSSSPNYFGGNIPWNGGSEYWAMLLDNNGNLIDFVGVNFDSTEIQSIDVVINGFNVVVGSQWTSAGAPANTSTSTERVGNSDNNSASDWQLAGTPSPGMPNSGIIVPFIGGANICAGPLVLMADVNVIPDPMITPEPAACFAEPSRTLMVDIPGGTWSGTGITDAAVGIFDPGVAGLGTHQIIYSITAANGCSGADTIDIVVNSSPDATITGPYSICADAGLVTFTAPSSGGAFTGVGITDTLNGTFDPAVSGVGTFIITYAIDLTGCQDIDTHMIVVRPTPDATITAFGPLCSNDAPVMLTAAEMGGTFTGTGVVGNMFDPNLAGPGFHQITYNITNSFGCSNTGVFTVEVRLQPDATISGPSVLCFNDAAVQYTAPTPGGVWLGNGLDATGMFDPSVAGLGMHMLVYSVQNNGCNDADTFYVTVNSIPNVIINQVNPVCLNSAPVQLMANIGNGTWTGAGVNASGMFDPSVAGIGTHIISYDVTNANNCTGTGTVTITVIAAPTVSISAAGPYCSNGTAVALTGSPAGGVWTGAGILNQFTGLFDPSNAGAGTHMISYSVTNGNGCTTTETVTITVNAAPDATITKAGPFCGNATSVQLSAATPGGTWSGTGVSASGMFNPVTAGPGAHIITYTVTGTNGCTSVATSTIMVSSDITINGAATAERCAGQNNGAVSITAEGGLPPFSYNWSNGATTRNLMNVAPGSYTVTVTDAAGCTETQSFTVDPGSTITITIDSVMAALTPSNANGAVYISVAGGTPPYNYIWSNGNNSQDLLSVSTDTFSVTVVGAKGCRSTITVFVPSLFGVGIDQNDDIVEVSLYPNPSSGRMIFDMELKTNQEVTFEVMDVLGRTLFTADKGTTSGFTEQLDFSEFAAGHYLFRIKIGEEILMKKFIISR